MQVMTGRIFVVLVTAVAYVIALRIPQSIFDVATQYAFAGYAALVPLLVAALFWKNSTRWGALATTLWTAAAVMTVAVIQKTIAAPRPGRQIVVWAIGDLGDRHARRGRDVRHGDAAGRADDADLGDADDRRVARDEGVRETGRGHTAALLRRMLTVRVVGGRRRTSRSMVADAARRLASCVQTHSISYLLISCSSLISQLLLS